MGHLNFAPFGIFAKMPDPARPMAGAFATVHHGENVGGFVMPRDTWPSPHAPTRAGADIFAKGCAYSEGH
jgi:hypothetical protein